MFNYYIKPITLNHGKPTPRKIVMYMMDMPKPIFHHVANGT